MFSFKIAISVLLAIIGLAVTANGASSVSNAKYGYPRATGTIFADNLGSPREIKVLSNGDVAVLERDAERVVRLWDANGDGYADSSERLVIAQAPGLNHAVLIYKGALYASSSTTVYKWTGVNGSRMILRGPQKIVYNIPAGGHSTRTLLFDDKDLLYVTLGSQSNLDPLNGPRAQIRRFNLSGSLPKQWSQGELFAYGVRNIVGLTLDNNKNIWGVEMGFDESSSYRGDAPTDDNPLEELNFFNKNRSNVFYGYPKCFTAGNVAGKKLGTQVGLDPADDAWCGNPANNFPAALGFLAHSAPINVVFYPSAATTKKFGFRNQSWNAFVSLHGSWNRDTPSGYRVVKVNFSKSWPRSYEPFFYWSGSSNSSTTPQDGSGWGRHPTGLAIGAQGELFVADDAQGDIVVIRGSA